MYAGIVTWRYQFRVRLQVVETAVAVIIARRGGQSTGQSTGAGCVALRVRVSVVVCFRIRIGLDIERQRGVDGKSE